MQTFLPHPDFTQSAACLDQRLEKQRVEVIQLLNSLLGKSIFTKTEKETTMREKIKRLTNESFLKVCDTCRNHAEEIMKNVHSNVELVEFIKDKTGIDVAEFSCQTILKACGIEIKKKRDNVICKNMTNIATLTIAIYRLYKKLGEEVPLGLAEMFDKLPKPPVPVSTIKGSATIPVVTLNEKQNQRT